MSETNMPKPGLDEEQLNTFFRRIYYSRRYENYIREQIGDVANHKYQGNFMEAWWDLTNQFCALVKGDALPVLWDGQEKAAEVVDTMTAMKRWSMGYLLIGFATVSNSSRSKVLRARPLPIFKGDEVATVTEVIKAAHTR